jgi:biotin carboxyl carrier protein
MGTAQLVNLTVRPSQAAKLAFNDNGIVEESNVQLGVSVTPFDFESFYAGLGATVLGASSQLLYGSGGIQNDAAVQASILLALRAESKKALLDKAIAARQNAYYAKYQNSAAIIALMQQYYGPGASAKPAMLAALSVISQNQANWLQAAYSADGRLSVVKSTTSQFNSSTDSRGETNSSTTGTSTSSSGGVTNQQTRSNTFENLTTMVLSNTGTMGTSDTAAVTTGIDNTSGPIFGATFGSTTSTVKGSQQSSSQGQTQSSGSATQSQSGTYTAYGYRVPSLESTAQNLRAQISLNDQQFAQFMSGQTLPNLAQVFINELGMLDLDIKRLQVAYLDTILMSPINGTVTGVFKQVGDFVRAGEAVVRVENNVSVLLIGTLIYRGMVSIGATVTIQTTLFSDPSNSTSVTGTIVAARGHSHHDDWWEVVVSCSNVDSSGNPIFPLHYSFDHDDTSVTIS